MNTNTFCVSINTNNVLSFTVNTGYENTGYKNTGYKNTGYKNHIMENSPIH